MRLMDRIMRNTSLAAYKKYVENGFLSQKRGQVYAYVFISGPCTQEIAERAIQPNLHNGSVTARFSELERMGLIEEVGKVVNTRGNTVSLFDVTAREDPIPLKRTQGITQKQIINVMAEQIQHILQAMEASKNVEKTEKWKTWIDRSNAVLKDAAKYIKKKKNLDAL